MSVVEALLNVRSVDDALKLLNGVSTSLSSSDPLASFFEPRLTFGAPAEPLLLAGTLVALTVVMILLR